MATKCKRVVIPPGASGRRRSFSRKLCWSKRGIKTNCKPSATTAACGGGRASSRSSGRKRSSASRRTRKVTVSRNTLKTFIAKKSYAVTRSGKLRKGCKRVKNTYRCKKVGAARG